MRIVLLITSGEVEGLFCSDDGCGGGLVELVALWFGLSIKLGRLPPALGAVVLLRVFPATGLPN